MSGGKVRGKCHGVNDFVKSIMGQSAQVLNQDATMEKFQLKILDVLALLSLGMVGGYQKCPR